MNPFVFIRTLVLFCFVSIATIAAPVEYSNPVLPGDFPDPSVIRVGDDFWATATSSEWGPLFPILHSKDLVNWELRGHIFQEKPQWSSRNYWAPEMWFQKDTYYVYYVGRKGDNGPLALAVATAKSPTGPWTDHGPMIAQDEGSIDAFPFVDGEDLYLFWKNDGNSRKLPTMIWGQKLSPDGTKLVGEMKEMFRNDAPWEGNLVEGPALIKRNGWYYIFYAGNGCCGRGCTYGVGVARSRNVLGPYEKCPRNPLMVGNEKWKCPGHGTIVSTGGRDFFMYHAYEKRDFVWVGRQGMLDEIKWGEDQWPIVNAGQGSSVSAPSPFGKPQRFDHEFFDDFATEKLGVRWQWPHSLTPRFKLSENTLQLSSTAGADLFGSVLAVQTTTADYAATAVLHANEIKPGTKAGLYAFGDRQNAIGIVLDDGKASVVRRMKDKTETLASSAPLKTDKIHFRVRSTGGHKFQFLVWDGKQWTKVGGDSDLEGDFLPPWDRGVRVALVVGGVEGASAKFDWLRVVPTTSTYGHQ